MDVLLNIQYRKKSLEKILFTISKQLFSAIIFFLLVSIFAINSSSIAMADEPRIQKLKAAFIYNFARYIEWKQLPDDKIHFCIVGNETFSKLIKNNLINKKLHKKKIEVIKIGANDTVNSCQITYVATGYEFQIFGLRSYHPKQVLTIGEGESFAKKYGLIGFYEQGNRLRFAINLNRSRKSGLKISARLLHLAKIVE